MGCGLDHPDRIADQHATCDQTWKTVHWQGISGRVGLSWSRLLIATEN